jgi:hypothetical protein
VIQWARAGWTGHFGGSCESRSSRENKVREGFSCISHPFAPFVFQTAHDEQHRIVVYLDDLQAQVDELTALVEELTILCKHKRHDPSHCLIQNYKRGSQNGHRATEKLSD